MELGLPELSPDQPTVEQARDLINTVYHEARHAEQWFRIAQLRAQQRRRAPGVPPDARLAADVKAELGIPLNIAVAAVKTPLPGGAMQALIAQGWFDSVYGSGRPRRDRIMAELSAANAALATASARAAASKTAANVAAQARAEARVNKAVAAVETLEVEDDAGATGPMAAVGVSRGAPDPPKPPPPVDPSLGGIQTDLQQLVGVA